MLEIVFNKILFTIYIYSQRVTNEKLQCLFSLQMLATYYVN